jgi:glycogen operon protein
VRRYWRGDPGQISELASRLAGSSDIFSHSDRGVYASINFISAHDGYTLRDLVSYEQKHNEANGENNRDGHDDNVSRNWGVEGETQDQTIIETRYRLMRAFLATLAFSQGVPMLAHGDELGRTQGGNNNAYAQDNESTWVNWDLDDRQKQLLEFTRKVLALRQANPTLRRRHFFRGAAVEGANRKDVTWIGPDGKELTEVDWRNPEAHLLGMLIDGAATDDVDERGHAVLADTLLLVTNSGDAPASFTLPTVDGADIWVMMDSARDETPVVNDNTVMVEAHALMLLRFGTDRRVQAPEEKRREKLSVVEQHTL